MAALADLRRVVGFLDGIKGGSGTIQQRQELVGVEGCSDHFRDSWVMADSEVQGDKPRILDLRVEDDRHGYHITNGARSG